MDDDQLREALERFLIGELGHEVRIGRLQPLPGGASRKIYAFDLVDEIAGDHEPSPLVLRMDPEAGRLQSDRAEEYALLAAAHAAGVTVPAVRWLGTEKAGLGASFVVMDRVEGQAIARRLLRDDAYAHTREVLPAQLARELARIHAIDVGAPGLESLRRSAADAGAGLDASDPRRFARAEIRRYRELLAVFDGDYPRPVFELAGRWLERNAPAVERPAVVHGDFRIGNILFDESGLTAVLDWELAHLGDPLEDLGWLTVRAWRFGVDERPVGGLCARQALWELYERSGGQPVSVPAARYWEIFGNWKWAVICVAQAGGHKAGRFPNVELAALGRRVAEVEWELLGLLCEAFRDGAGNGDAQSSPPPSSDPPGSQATAAGAGSPVAAEPAAPTTVGRPSAAELLEAVAAFLTEEVVPTFRGRQRFHALVAANVARVVARETERGAAIIERQCADLWRLLGRPGALPSKYRPVELAIDLETELCKRIRAGEADADPWRTPVLAFLENDVRARLEIENPDLAVKRR
jgi:aminoglycoside phosphotransferase (APT) family kinase protein